MEAINYESMKTNEPTRNFDSVDITNDYNVAAQNSQGLYGAFKFFHGIKSFFKGISALGTLATTSKIPVTDDDGNVTYTTPAAIKTALSLVDSTALNGALAKYDLNTYRKKYVNNETANDKYYKITNMKETTFTYSDNYGNFALVSGGSVKQITYQAKNSSQKKLYGITFNGDDIFLKLGNYVHCEIAIISSNSESAKVMSEVTNTEYSSGTAYTEIDTLNGALSNYPFIVNATLSENKTINANSYVDITINYSDVGFTPTKVIVQLSNRISKLAVASVSSVGITSTSCNIRLFNHESVVYNLDASNAKFFVLVQK